MEMSWKDLTPFQTGYVSAALNEFEESGTWQLLTGESAGPLLRDLDPGTLADMLRDADAFHRATHFLIPEMVIGETARAGRAFWYTRNDVEGRGFDDDTWDPSTTVLTIAAQATGPYRLGLNGTGFKLVRTGP